MSSNKAYKVTQFIALYADPSSSGYSAKFRYRNTAGIKVPLNGSIISAKTKVDSQTVGQWTASANAKVKSEIHIRRSDIIDLWNIRVLIAQYNGQSEPEKYVLCEWTSERAHSTAERSWILVKEGALKNEDQSTHSHFETNWKAGWNEFDTFLKNKSESLNGRNANSDSNESKSNESNQSSLSNHLHTIFKSLSDIATKTLTLPTLQIELNSLTNYARLLSDSVDL